MADTHDRQPDTSALTLRDAFAGVAVAARAIVPFERMGISLLEDPGTVRVHLLAGPGAEHFTEHVLARPHYSGCLWPAPGGGPICIRDSARELDLSYPIDRRVVDAGRRSVLAISLEAQGTQLGVLWFDSHRVEAFSAGDAIALGPLADLLAVAVVLWANRIADHVALALAHERLGEEGRRAAQAREREARLQERVETLVHELEGRGAHRAMAPLPPASIPAEGVTLEQVEHALLVKALAQARNNKSQAAKLLGLPRGQLYSLLRRHGLTEARR